MGAPTQKQGGAEAAQAVFEELFYTTAGRTDPYPLYQRLREASPVHRADQGMWILSRYDDCWATLRDPRFGKDYGLLIEQRFGKDWRDSAALESGERSMVNMGGADHTRLRKLVSKGFTPRMIQRLEPSIEKTLAQMLDPFVEAGGGDILEAVGFPLPVTVIGEMLGVPEADRAGFRDSVRDLVATVEMKPTAEQMAVADAAQVSMREYFLELIAEKRRRPGDDLLSVLAAVDDRGDRLSDEELVRLAQLLFAAGFETTTNLLGNGLLGLLREPEQLELLRRDRQLLDGVSEEILRYDGTAQLVNRVTDAEVEVSGVTIPAGEVVFALIGAGNHDPARYENPDKLDVTRTDIQPLSFGGGVHFCLGAALARTEIRMTLGALLDRCGEIELAGEPPAFQDRLVLRGMATLPIACRPAAAPKAAARPASAPLPTAAERAATVARPTRTRTEGLRPGSADPDGDVRWRAELRQRIEREPKRADSLPVLTGKQLAATSALLARNTLFERCSTAQLAELAETAYPMSFEPGDMLCIEGAESPEAYMVEVGQAVVTIAGKGVGKIDEGDVVGERGVVLDTVRSATVTAASHMITYAVSRDRLRALVEGNPEVRDWMIEDMRRRYPNLEKS